MERQLSRERNRDIAVKVASGCSQTQVAQEYGISQQRVDQITRKPDIKVLIETIRERTIVDCAEQALVNIKEIINSKEKDDRPLKLKYSAKILESIGALASYTQSIFVQNIYQQNNDVYLEQAAELAFKHLGIDSIKVIDLEEDL
jgi:hypothetical protein